MTTLRDRKKERTRQRLVEVATELFTKQGYERTTIAEIAAAADIGTRTFFSYFATKEDLLFPQKDARVQAALHAIANRGPQESPAEVLLRAVAEAVLPDDDMVSPLAALRIELALTIPALLGKMVHYQLESTLEIARQLAAAYPDRLDEVSAAALAGAMVGAVAPILRVLLADERAVAEGPGYLKDRLQQALRVALAPESNEDRGTNIQQ
jgi:AcrR family transcriptional regulator